MTSHPLKSGMDGSGVHWVRSTGNQGGISAHPLGARPGPEQVDRLLVLQIAQCRIRPRCQQASHDRLLGWPRGQGGRHVEGCVPMGLHVDKGPQVPSRQLQQELNQSRVGGLHSQVQNCLVALDLLWGGGWQRSGQFSHLGLLSWKPQVLRDPVFVSPLQALKGAKDVDLADLSYMSNIIRLQVLCTIQEYQV